VSSGSALVRYLALTGATTYGAFAGHWVWEAWGHPAGTLEVRSSRVQGLVGLLGLGESIGHQCGRRSFRPYAPPRGCV
jgi:hypothetical protein